MNPFWRDHHGVLWLGALPVMGGWLPFIGWRDTPVDEDGFVLLDDEVGRHAGYRPVFQVEWLGFGVSAQCEPDNGKD